MQLNLNELVGPFFKRVGVIERKWLLMLPKPKENFEFFPIFHLPFHMPFFPPCSCQPTWAPGWRRSPPLWPWAASLQAGTASHVRQCLSEQQLSEVHKREEGREHQANFNLWPSQGFEPKPLEIKGRCPYFSSEKPFGLHIDRSPWETVSGWCTAEWNGSVNVCDVHGLVNRASLLWNELLAK